jgi:hypothetical protein
MIAADVIRLLTLGTIPLLFVSRRLDMTALYAIAAVTGSASVFFAISYQAYAPVIVRSDRLNEANQRLEFSNSGSAMAGNALAGYSYSGLALPRQYDRRRVVSRLQSCRSRAFVRRRQRMTDRHSRCCRLTRDA